MRKRTIVFLLVCVCAIPSGMAMAQTITAGMRGTIRDRQGGVLPGVTVTVKSPALIAGAMSTVSGPDGVYLVTNLPPGSYEITADLPGFSTTIVTGLQLSIRSTLEMDLTMEVASAKETITVTGRAELIDTSQSEARTIISQQVIDTTPLNGRQFTDLVALSPGITKDPGQTEFSVFAERNGATKFLTDGIENSDSYTGNFAQHFNQDAIQEFEVNLSGYMPEFGRGSAGALNIITRSGSDALQGSAFYYLRRDGLDSANVKGATKPTLSRNNAGVTVGGPISRTKVWFFYAYEYNGEDRGTNFGATQQLISDTVRQGYFTTVGRKDGRPTPEDFATLTTSRLNSHFGKVTATLGSKNTLNVQGNVDRRSAWGSNLLAGQPKGDENDPLLPSGADFVVPHSYSASLNDSHILSALAVLDSRFRYLRLETDKNLDRIAAGDVTLPNVRLFTGEGQFQTSLSTRELGGIASRRDSQLEWVEELSYASANHTVKVGGGFKRQGVSGFFLNPFNIGFTQASLISSGSIIPLLGQGGFEVEGFRNINSNLAGGGVGRAELDMRNNIWGTFAQDSWKVGDRFTLNMGLRYDWESLFGADKNNLSPRVGFAWDVTGRRKTVVRGSAGVYYDKNVLGAVEQVPDFGGVANGRGADAFLPRLGYTWGVSAGPGYADYDRLTPQQVLANPVTYDLVAKDILVFLFMVNGNGPHAGVRNFAAALSRNPLSVYQLLGIPVSDPTQPPVVNYDNVSQLTGGQLTPDRAVEKLNEAFPGANFIWTPFASPLIGGRVLTFEAFPGLDPTGRVGFFQGIETPIRTPVTYSGSIGLQHELSPNLSAQFEYIHRNTDNVLARRLVNLNDDPSNERGLRGNCYAAAGAAAGQCYQQLGYAGLIRYRGIIAALEKRYANRHYFRLSYTYSRARDNITSDMVVPINQFTDANNPMKDYGRSTRAIPHVFVGSGSYTLPYDLTFSSVVTWRSGRPFTADGVGDYDGEGFNDFFDTRTEGRGAFLLPTFFQWDFRAAKSFSIGARTKLTCIGEVFNATNRANAAQVIGSYDSPNFRKPINFFPGREVQLAARLSF